MKPETTADTLAAMEAMLRPCRRRIALASVHARLRMALPRGAKELLVVAAVFLLLRALSRLAGTPAPGPVPVLVLFALILLAVFVRALVSGFRGTPHDPGHAAERLDLAQAGHNRIATAIALLRSGDDSPFARAAIRDGFEHLERLKAEKPYSDPTPLRWQRTCLSAIAAFALLLAGLGLSPKYRGDGMPADPANAENGKASPETDPTRPVPPQDAVARQAEKEARDGGGKPRDAVRKEERSERPEPGTGSRSEGGMGRQSAGVSRSGQVASNSSSAASGGGAKSEPGEAETATPPRKRNDRKPQTAARPKPEEEEKQGGSINASGSSGSGTMQSAQSDWASKEKAKSDDSDDFQPEEASDEEMDPDKQRLGVQPALKNRTSKVSRELSLMMGIEPQNSQKRGRGGPGGQKKTRGTATMIMGVPVPGFVRGRLLPGPTKSTREEVEPSPREGEFAAAFGFPQTLPEEDAQETFRAPADIGASARDYLIQYHQEHDKQRNDDAPSE